MDLANKKPDDNHYSTITKYWLFDGNSPGVVNSRAVVCN